jgi:hypothetical protein
MIDGLMLTFFGEELRALLDERARHHEETARGWTSETQRTPDSETDDAPLLPEQICENEAERHAWRAGVLAFMRDHVDAGETYRLGAADLEFGELLPEKPGWVEQDDYEQQARIGFNLERLVKSIDRLVSLGVFMPGRADSGREEFGATRETILGETDQFRTSSVEVENGPEIVKIERK